MYTVLFVLSILELVAVILLLDIKKKTGTGFKYDKLLVFNISAFSIFLLLSVSVYSVTNNTMLGGSLIVVLMMGIVAYFAAFVVFLAIPNLGLGLRVSSFGQLKTRQDIADEDVKKKMNAVLGLILIPNWILSVIAGIISIILIGIIGNIVF